MTSALSRALPIVAEKPCDGLGSRIWQTFLSAAAFTLLGVTLSWLFQTAQTAAPAFTWWKVMVALGSVLAATYFLRIARRLDGHAKQGWTLSDWVLVLAGGFMTANLVMRSGGLWGALLIALFLVIESHSLWRLRLLPMHRLHKRNAEPRHSTLASSASSNSALPITQADESDVSISQQLTRKSTDDGEVIHGFVRGRIGAGELATGIDIAFCPTFDAEPKLEFEAHCDEELNVQISALRTYGAHIEARRKGEAQSDLPFTLELHISSGSEVEAAEATREPTDS
jgi:hypothetical protein